MSTDTKHTIGAVLLWGSIGIAALGTWMTSILQNPLGLIVLTVSVPLAFVGALIKRATCPRCRAQEVCTVQVREETRR